MKAFAATADYLEWDIEGSVICVNCAKEEGLNKGDIYDKIPIIQFLRVLYDTN